MYSFDACAFHINLKLFCSSSREGWMPNARVHACNYADCCAGRSTASVVCERSVVPCGHVCPGGLATCSQ